MYVVVHVIPGRQDCIWTKSIGLARKTSRLIVGVQKHGDTTMIPLTRLASYNGIPVSEFLSAAELEKVAADSDRDYWLRAQEAKDYGMIDEVLIRTAKKDSK